MTVTKSYFRIHTTALRITGVSFRDYEGFGYKILSKIVLLISCAYPFLDAGDIFKHDFETVTDLLIYEFSMFIGVIKAITVLLNREKIARVLNKLDTDVSIEKFAKGDSFLEQLTKQCTFIVTAQTAAYWVVTVVSFSFSFSYSLAKRIKSNDYHDWQFPYGAFTVLNVTYSPNYEISWLYQSVAVGIVAIQFINIDLLMAAVLCHICCHLKILQNNLRKLVENAEKKKALTISNMTTKTGRVNCTPVNSNNPPEWKYLHASLKREVRYHLAVINITEEVNESFSTLLMLVFLATLGVMSFMVYKASVIPLMDFRMLQTFGEFIIIIFQVLMVCFWCEQMVMEGDQVGAAAYEANFVGMDLRLQKGLVLIMRRSQNRIKLTAGFVEVSLATFTWILRSAYSAFMVLRKHNLEDG